MLHTESIPYYISLLADRATEQRAIDGLVVIGASAIPALLAALREPDSWYAAATALARIGQPAIPALVELLQSPPWSNFAFHALSEMGEIAVPDLIAALSHPNDEVRMWAATAFTFLPDMRARDSLRGALSDSDPLVRETAARALSILGQ